MSKQLYYIITNKYIELNIDYKWMILDKYIYI